MTGTSVSTNNIWPYYSKTNVDNTKSKGNELGKDQFLKILITQLANQDPTQPLEDKEFISQMAQFSSVEQLTNMSQEMKLLRQSMGIAPGLIGKSVSWSAKDSNGEDVVKEGVVTAITFKDGQQQVSVNGENISLDKLIKIWVPEDSK